MSDIKEKSNFAVLCDACEFYGYYVSIHTIRTRKTTDPKKLKIAICDKNKKVILAKGQTHDGSPSLEFIAAKLMTELEERGLFEGDLDVA